MKTIEYVIIVITLCTVRKLTLGRPTSKTLRSVCVSMETQDAFNCSGGMQLLAESRRPWAGPTASLTESWQEQWRSQVEEPQEAEV